MSRPSVKEFQEAMRNMSEQNHKQIEEMKYPKEMHRVIDEQIFNMLHNECPEETDEECLKDFKPTYPHLKKNKKET